MYKKLSLWLLVVGMVVSMPFAKADVQDISFDFCDAPRGLAWSRNFIITPGEETEICIIFSTNAEAERNIVYGFTAWRLTQSGTPMCESDKGPDNAFSKFIPIKTERSFVISKDKPVTVKEKVIVPLGMSWIQYGCLAYSVASKTWSGGMFNIIVNKTFPISLFIGQWGDIKNEVVLVNTTWGVYTTNKKVKATIQENDRLQLDLLVKNQGNISQNVEITGTIHNILWFEKSFSASIGKLAPGAEKWITADVGIIPFYKGPFTVSYTVTNSPNFDFDIAGLDESIKKWKTLTWSAQIYIFSWISVIIILLVIAIILKLFRPRKRQVVAA